MALQNRLEFEKEIVDLEEMLAKLESNPQLSSGEEVRRIRR